MNDTMDGVTVTVSLPSPAAAATDDEKAATAKTATAAAFKVERRRRQWRRAAACCRRTVAFVFSHVGLAATVVAYSVAGGFLFRALEASHEVAQKQVFAAYKRPAVDEVWRLAVEHQRLLARYAEPRAAVNFTDRVWDVLDKFQTRVAAAIRDEGWDGKDDVDSLLWSYPGALLYAVTVITTIGRCSQRRRSSPRERDVIAITARRRCISELRYLFKW